MARDECDEFLRAWASHRYAWGNSPSPRCAPSPCAAGALAGGPERTAPVEARPRRSFSAELRDDRLNEPHGPARRAPAQEEQREGNEGERNPRVVGRERSSGCEYAEACNASSDVLGQ